ncbi:MAG: 5'-methylthioadenosine/adenosylhomocysteine nucleosidase [Eubacterium sp.]|nr:5'-methylthioadenosine/adenosylhomocysteine nucleosidase [Eubacterium sp.]
MIGIIGAMDVEVDALKKLVKSPVTTRLAGCDFVCGTINDVMVCVCRCSAGKVNAAFCTQLMIDKFGAEKIINVGVGCSLDKKVVIKNVVIATEVCQYDIDVTALGEPRGFINGLNTVKVSCDKELSDALARCAISCGEKIHRGCIASGDTFIASSEMKAELASRFSALCGEMEGGAIGHTCAANGIPFAVIRSISDGGNENVQLDYPTFKPLAAKISATIILKYLETQKDQLEF